MLLCKRKLETFANTSSIKCVCSNECNVQNLCTMSIIEISQLPMSGKNLRRVLMVGQKYKVLLDPIYQKTGEIR